MRRCQSVWHRLLSQEDSWSCRESAFDLGRKARYVLGLLQPVLTNQLLVYLYFELCYWRLDNFRQHCDLIHYQLGSKRHTDHCLMPGLQRQRLHRCIRQKLLN